MSGPKVHHYRVISAEEIRRREDDARRAKCESLATKCRTEARKLKSPSSVTIPALRIDTHDGLIEWETQLNDALSTIVLLQDKENAKRIVRRLRVNSPELDVTRVTLGMKTMPREKGCAERLSFIEHEVASLVPLLGKIRDQKRSAELLDAIERLAGYDDQAQARGDLLTLKSRLNDLLSQQDLCDMAEAEVMRVAHMEGSDAENLRRDAKEVTSKAGLDDIKRRVAKLLAVEKTRQDEEFVAKALEEVLSDLGFDARNGFEVTDFGKVAIAESVDYPGYALRLQVNPKNGMLYTRMVALETHDAAVDAKVEQESCGSIKSLRDRLAKLGIEAELTSERPSGERPVEVLDGSAITSQVNKRRRASAGKVMSNAR